MADPQRLSSRTNSIWLTQLLLALAVVVVVLLVQAVDPDTMEEWTFSAGVSTIIVVTAVALITPWNKLPVWAALSIPLIDIFAIGVLASQTDIDLAFLWAFPVIWIASHFGTAQITASLVLIGAMVLLSEVARPGNTSASLRVIVVTLTLTFIAISTRLAARQTRAFKRLLLREAGKLNEALDRTTRQERQLSQVLATIDVGIARISPGGEVLECNASYRTLYGMTSLDPNLPPSSVEYDSRLGSPLSSDERPLSRVQRGEQFDDVRAWLFDSAGKWHALSLTARALPTAEGSSTGSLLIAHDVTALLQAEQASEQLTARVSHELRNPLTTVIGFSDLLLDSDEIKGRTREHIHEISAAGERMLMLTNTILKAGKEARDEATPVGPADLARIVSQSVESFGPMAAASGVKLEWDRSHAVTVIGDAFRLRQVVDNLVSNAVKYTPKNGSVTIELTATEENVILRIIDTGQGMDAEEVDRIFEPYFRAASAVSSGVQGTGLGMGIVKSLVDEHHGTMSVTSRPMRGTTMTVTLPAAPADATEEEPTHV
ncbi:sensor histidine kinase (plasmid) [Coraliomargarita sp. W4R53]